MRDQDFLALRARLLRGGLAPKHVNRTLRELRHHLADLEHKALSEGLSPQDASIRAAEQLGDHELIIEEALARPELRSWSHRWPWGIYGILPIIALVLTAAGSMFAFMALLDFAQSNSDLSPAAFANALFDPWWLRALMEAWRLGMVYVLPVVFAGSLCIFAARRETPILWPSIGAFLILFLGFCYDVSIVAPSGPDSLAEFGASIGFAPHLLVSVRVLRFLVPLLLVLGPYYWWRQRQHQRFA